MLDPKKTKKTKMNQGFKTNLSLWV